MTNTILGYLLPQAMYAPEGLATPEPAAPAPAPAPAADDDDDFKDEEVVVPGDDPEGDGEPPATPPAAAEPPRKRGPKRYAELNRRVEAATSYAERVAAENEALKKRAEDAEKKAEESQEVAMQTYAAKAKSDLDAAKKANIDALASNDPEKITNAAEALSSARAAFDDVEAFKKQPKAAPAAPSAPASPAAERKPVQDLPEPIRDFAVANRYWDTVARDDNGEMILDRKTGEPQRNPEFNADMHAEVTLFATSLERQIKNGKKSFKTASPEYFAEVEKHMREEFPEYFEDDEDAPTAPRPRHSPVAAPSGRTAPGAAPKNGGQKLTLTADQVRFVTKQVANGGGPKYPKGHPQQFKPMTLPDAKVSYARRILSQAKENQ